MSKADLKQASHFLDCTRGINEAGREWTKKCRTDKQRLIVSFYYEEWAWSYVLAALELYARHHGSMKERRRRQRERRRHEAKHCIPT